MGQELFRTTGEFVPDKLIAGNAIPIITKGVRIAEGQGVLKRGTLLGVANDGSFKVIGGQENAGEGGIECDCILAEDVDTTAEDAVAAAYVSGMFNRDAVILAEGAEIDSYETELRKLGIFLKAAQEY